MIDLMGSLAASGVQPLQDQGNHVRLTVKALGSIGADTEHKVFWVTCEAAPAPATSPTSAPTVLPTTVTPAPSTVLPTTITPPPSTGPLAFTGDDAGRRLFAALALLLFGSAALHASHRRERRHYHR